MSCDGREQTNGRWRCPFDLRIFFDGFAQCFVLDCTFCALERLLGATLATLVIKLGHWIRTRTTHIMNKQHSQKRKQSDASACNTHFAQQSPSAHAHAQARVQAPCACACASACACACACNNTTHTFAQQSPSDVWMCPITCAPKIVFKCSSVIVGVTALRAWSIEIRHQILAGKVSNAQAAP